MDDLSPPTENRPPDTEERVAELHRSIGEMLLEEQHTREALAEYQTALGLLEKEIGAANSAEAGS